MGHTFSVLKVTFQTLPDIYSRYSDAIKRVQTSPGIPQQNPPPSFWASDTEIPSLSIQTELPAYADIVLIGSGITGASVAHTLLTRSDEKKINKIVVIDIRDICGGATGRNGGHCKGETWGDYDELAETFGEDAAQDIQRFRRTSLHDLIKIDQEYCAGKGGVRNVETLDVFYTDEGWKDAIKKLTIWRKAMDEDGERKAFTHEIWEGTSAQQKWNVSSETIGVIWSKANVGLLNSYRLFTSLWSYLSTTYPSRLSLVPNTTVTSISSSSSSQLYTIQTSRGVIKTPRILHGTNAFISHLIPSLRSRIVPVRLSLAAQNPGSSFLENLTPGTRSWCLYYDYLRYSFLSQLPLSPSKFPNGELIFGGGINYAKNSGFGELCNVDESSIDIGIHSYLEGSLPIYFDHKNWGKESNGARTVSSWSGIMGLSSDGLPWVGKLPTSLTPRIPPKNGGEWISAGFSGEGMVHGWGCGRAVALMILGLDPLPGEEIPDQFVITEKRVKNTGKPAQVIKEFEEE